ncbi:rhodanese-related sulfurtransferase [Enterobacteriaceae endosymbiont of Plateumaris pusilla]|uniref:oxygen-dependent tRNA uridine(34) hydroxylase TrhO n=1 Tax=Enterobacteriaceae endosymbiont of Plateumaris pusilla TaxID=2675795 RepID=UPI001448FC10|nr:rhodanese-related sulfurtransferase [Enterobacteriaceae endosymbiont of Plateumaris pusilla]QJC29455.1 rhodanese-related sulfurtransferase [Enterobacteriaceae endosymbiont of Plateumaris pusilla]
MLLHNRESNSKLRKIIFKNNEERKIISFYKYFFINDPLEFRNNIYILFNTINIFGRIYISYEGINAQISIPNYFYEIMKFFLYKLHPQLKNLYINSAIENKKNAFWVLRVINKKNIINDGIKNFNFLQFIIVGKYLNAYQVNKMIDCNNTVIIDIRNYYEYKIGHFNNAIIFRPANNFREQMSTLLYNLQQYKNKNIILYCTGGIRCEKATSWLIYNNFKNIFHIKGGIIGYINDAKKNNLPIKFKGKNFVFDNRMSELVTKDIISHCYQCNNYYDIYTNCKNNFCHLLFIQCSSCKDKYHNCCSEKCINIYFKYKINSR